MAKTMTPTEFANEIGSDPRTVRKFLRSNGTKVGKGHRHTIPADAKSLKALGKQFAAWNESRTAKANDAADEALTDADTTDDTPADLLAE